MGKGAYQEGGALWESGFCYGKRITVEIVDNI